MTSARTRPSYIVLVLLVVVGGAMSFALRRHLFQLDQSGSIFPRVFIVTVVAGVWLASKLLMDVRDRR